MSSNQQRAVEVLNRHWNVAQETQQDDEAVCCAQALADAGLLMPDLPEPELPGLWEVGELLISLVDKDGDVLIEWDEESDYAYYGTQTRTLWLNRDQVLAILAAADHMEKNA